MRVESQKGASAISQSDECPQNAHTGLPGTKNSAVAVNQLPGFTTRFLEPGMGVEPTT